MGGVTPHYSLRYPYQHETPTLAHFQNLADDIDAAVDTVQAARTAAQNRPYWVARTVTPSPSMASGAVHWWSWPTPIHSPAGWWSAGSPTLVSLPGGIYHMAAWGGAMTSTTTTNAMVWAFQVNSVDILRAATPGWPQFGNLSGVFYVPPGGQNVRYGQVWVGTGGPSTISGPVLLRIRQIKAI